MSSPTYARQSEYCIRTVNTATIPYVVRLEAALHTREKHPHFIYHSFARMGLTRKRESRLVRIGWEDNYRRGQGEWYDHYCACFTDYRMPLHSFKALSVSQRLVLVQRLLHVNECHPDFEYSVMEHQVAPVELFLPVKDVMNHVIKDGNWLVNPYVNKPSKLVMNNEGIYFLYIKVMRALSNESVYQDGA